MRQPRCSTVMSDVEAIAGAKPPVFRAGKHYMVKLDVICYQVLKPRHCLPSHSTVTTNKRTRLLPEGIYAVLAQLHQPSHCAALAPELSRASVYRYL